MVVLEQQAQVGHKAQVDRRALMVVLEQQVHKAQVDHRVIQDQVDHQALAAI